MFLSFAFFSWCCYVLTADAFTGTHVRNHKCANHNNRLLWPSFLRTFFFPHFCFFFHLLHQDLFFYGLMEETHDDSPGGAEGGLFMDPEPSLPHLQDLTHTRSRRIYKFYPSVTARACMWSCVGVCDRKNTRVGL